MYLHWAGPDAIGFSGQVTRSLWSHGCRNQLEFYSYSKWSYKQNRFPKIAELLIPKTTEKWIAIFSTGIELVFVPVLEILSRNQSTITIQDDILYPHSLRNHELLIVNRRTCKTVETVINDNGINSLAAFNVTESGDYIIIAPSTRHFQLITILRADLSVQHGFEWRNFSYNNGVVQSYFGHSLGDITNTQSKAFDVSDYVSPLAGGILLNVQAYTTLKSNDRASPSAYTYIGQDNIHVNSSVGLDRCQEYGAGVTGMVRQNFAGKKEIFVKVTPSTIGRVVFMGWYDT